MAKEEKITPSLEFFKLINRPGIGVIVGDKDKGFIAEFRKPKGEELYGQDFSHFDMSEEDVQALVDHIAELGIRAK